MSCIDPASGGSSGIYVGKLLERRGIADQVKPKEQLKDGGNVADYIVSGKAELGIHQISEILPVKGVTLVGPLPNDIQNYTVYAAGIGAGTKHADAVLVSHHYNWRAGTYKGAYSHGSSYALKPTAPDDAVDILSKSVFEPLLEKLLADGSVVEYEVDEESIHTESPNTFWVYYVTPTAEGLDKVNAGIRAALKANALIGPSFDSMVDFVPHRDSLTRTDATFK